ncbi:MAG: helix-turn-helix domain-containing protein [Isosphaeraceae bacterium]
MCATYGLTQQELGERVGMKKNTISRILSGQQEPKLQEAYELAKVLNVTVDYLVSEATELGPSVRLVEVTEDEVILLRTAQIIGVDVALRRILNAPPQPPDAEPPTPAPFEGPRRPSR